MEAKFSPRVKDVISYSREEALRLGNNFIGVEHLLLGILREGEGTAILILKDFNVNLHKLRKSIENHLIETNPKIDPLGNIPLAKEAEKVLKVSYLEAKLTKTAIIGTEHLFLSIIKQFEDTKKSSTNILFRTSDINYEKVHIYLKQQSLSKWNEDKNILQKEGIVNRAIKYLELNPTDLNLTPYGELFESIEYAINWKVVRKFTLESAGLNQLPLRFYEEARNCKYLKLTGNRIRELGDLSLFEVLEEIFLDDNEWSIVLDEIKKNSLPSLRVLSVVGNSIKRIPISLHKSIPNLEYLDLSFNSIEIIPSDFSNLLKLKKFGIFSNSIRILEEDLVELPQLVKLGLLDFNLITHRKNKIVALQRYEMAAKLRDSERLVKQNEYFLNNPISNIPIDVANQGLHYIRSYFDSLNKATELTTMNEAKLVLIGNGGVGKTTLIMNLINPEYRLSRHPSTHGLDLIPWYINDKNRKFRLNVWDFGGQGKYRSVQQFFCTADALYLYVTDPYENDVVEGEYYDGYHYWLNFISSLPKDKVQRDNTIVNPVLYILNKIDTHGSKFLDEKTINDKFSCISAFLKVSCKNGEGIDQLRDAIVQEMLKMQVCDYPFDEKWIEVKSIMEELRAIKPLLKYEDYIEIFQKTCSSSSDDILEQADVWLNHLVSIGSVLRFSEVDGLEDYIVLDPNWSREVAYKLLDSEIVQHKQGIFNREDRKKIWNTQKSGYSNLLNLVKSFEMVYERKLDGKTSYMVPAMMGNEVPSQTKQLVLNFKDKTSTYEYIFEDYLPPEIVSRLTVRQSRLVIDSTVWRFGGIFRLGDTHALVSENWKDKKITIELIGSRTIELLIILRNELELIRTKIMRNRGVDQIEVNEYISDNDKRVSLTDVLANIDIDSLISGKPESVTYIDTINIAGSEVNIADLIKKFK